jgi:hypothetical protein
VTARPYRRFKGVTPVDMKWCPECATIRDLCEFTQWKNGRRSTYCRSCQRLREIAYKYNIPIDEARKLDSVDTCAICNTKDPWPKTNLYIDHDHNSGDVRGVLCCNCNVFLGKSNDDPDLLLAAAKYLEERTP